MASHPRQLIVGLCGYAGCGKDSVAAVFQSRGFEKVAFADGVREVAQKLNVIIPGTEGKRYNELVQSLGYEQAKRSYPSVREHLVDIGHGCRSAISPDVWIMAGMHRAKQFPLVVISDVRYANEARAIRESGGVVIYIERPGVVACNETEAESIPQVEYDDLISNGGTLEDLAQVTTSKIQTLLQRYHRGD